MHIQHYIMQGLAKVHDVRGHMQLYQLLVSKPAAVVEGKAVVSVAVGAEGGLGDPALLDVNNSGVSADGALRLGRHTLRDEVEGLDDHTSERDHAPHF